MSIAVADDHRALANVARAFLDNHRALTSARHQLEAEGETLPAFWREVCEMGWPGLHVAEAFGGQGYGLAELAVVVAELGRVVAPGPLAPTAVAAAVVAEVGTPSQQDRWLRGLASGSTIGTVGLGGTAALTNSALDGDGGVFLCAGVADLFLVVAGDDVVVVEAAAEGVAVTEVESLDPTRRLGQVRLTSVRVDPSVVLAGGARVAERVGRALAAAEAAGGAHACTEMAVAYAKVREQFGRPIGSFQAVKHHAADMLVDAEMATAVAWDAARVAGVPGEAAHLVAAAAVAHGLPAYRRCAETSIQVHGGIGYTFEHDAHLYLRRAVALAALFGADDSAPRHVAELAAEGVERPASVDLPPAAEAFRAQESEFRARHDALPAAERKSALIDSGYLVPHWPRPWGRGAGAVEQLVIEEELGHVEQAELGIGGWVMMTIVQHASREQLARWVRPTLTGELSWCQLFSEPGAGSDAAAISTRGTRVDGGWLVTGQKVWTSNAHTCNRGLATVRTDPSAPKHSGVTTMAIDMRAAGVEVRPLRELTGEALFNEVFFDDVFVPDDDVVGEPNAGWVVARATLGNERVTIGGDSSALDLLRARDLIPLAEAGAAHLLGAVGVLVAEELAMAALNLRHVMRAVAGGPPGAEGNITKLLSGEHSQRVAALAVRIGGIGSITGSSLNADVVGCPSRAARDYLFTRCLTIAGGTSEIVRNQIAERLLGLPRDR